MKSRQGSKPRPRTDESLKSLDGFMQLFKEWRRTIGYYSIFAAVPTLMAGTSPDLRAEDVSGNSQTTIQNTISFRQQRSKPSEIPRASGQSPRFPDDTLLSSFTTIGSDDCPGTPIPSGSYTAASPYVDAGDTTGANDTVTSVQYYRCPYYCYNYQADSHGPDKIYSFVVTNVGVDPSITVTTTSPTYRPMIYVTSGCQAGQGNAVYTLIDDSRWGSGNTATVGWPGLYYAQLGRRYYLFVDSQVAAEGGNYALTVKDMQISTAIPVRANRPDFDGDGRADVSVYRPGDSTWYVDSSSHGFSVTQFGISTDQTAPADFDGDGKTDIAIFRDGDWWILRTSDSTAGVVSFGQAGDIPVPADYSGDGRSDIAVFRNGEWWMYNSANGQTSVASFGQGGDKPVPADYTGDGRSEIAVFRSGQWWIFDLATGHYSVVNLGQAGDRPIPGDYNGYGRSDPAVYRDGKWIFGPTNIAQWGLPTDVPVPGDYDGDGVTDMAIYRNGEWWIRRSQSGQLDVRVFGLAGDTPVPAMYSR